MQGNISDLPVVLELGRLGGRHAVSVSNVMPYTEEMLEQRLYNPHAQEHCLYAFTLPAAAEHA